MTDRHTDGNGVAGLLAQVLVVEPTTVERKCQGCGDVSPLGAHRAYHGASTVLRCPGCDAPAVQIGMVGERVAVRWFGMFRV
ncbi:MAG TPA: DUF6510 family protein [Solirubrobacteraceae bacterium]|nr:DUF6510 family protein [Solirubrobacteraceae bacterium]